MSKCRARAQTKCTKNAHAHAHVLPKKKTLKPYNPRVPLPTAFRADAPRRAPRRREVESGSKQTLWSQSPPTRRWSLVGGADEHLAARDPAASVSRLVTAQCALDCSLIQWCFGRRARARRDDRLNRSTASDRTAPHRTAPHRTAPPASRGGKNCSTIVCLSVRAVVGLCAF